jgi:hypothetical protein
MAGNDVSEERNTFVVRREVRKLVNRLNFIGTSLERLSWDPRKSKKVKVGPLLN